MSAARAFGALIARAWPVRTGIAVIALAALASCGPTTVDRPPTDQQSLSDIGNRNDDAAMQVAAEQRGRSRAQAVVIEADRREAERQSGGQE